jgi:hypothetical protein
MEEQRVKSEPFVLTSSSSKICKQLQIYLLANNAISFILTLCVLACLYQLNLVNNEDLNLIMAYFVLINLASILLYLKFTRKQFNFMRTKLSVKTRLQLVQLIQYLKELPLAFVCYFYFEKIYTSPHNTNCSFYYYFIFFMSFYFSLIGIFNCILIESSLDIEQHKSSSSLTFHFLFRYFNFLCKSIPLILLISSANNSSSFSIKLIILLYVFVSIVLFFTFSYSRSIRSKSIQSNQATRRTHEIMQSFYESFKMLIDFNRLYFESNNEPKKMFKLFKLTTLKLALLFFTQFVLVVCSAYIWFYKVIFIYNSSRTQTSLLSILTKFNNSRIALINLFEFEEKIKFRQLNFIVVVGSALISYLSYFIYFNYYSVGSEAKSPRANLNVNTSDNRCSSTHQIVPNPYMSNYFPERARKSSQNQTRIFNFQPSMVNVVDPIDGFSIDSYHQSSSIQTNSDILAFHYYDQLKSDDYSHFSSIKRSSSDSDLSSHVSSELKNYNTIHSSPYLLSRSINALSFDSSSGVISSELSSTTNSSDYTNLSYLKNCELRSVWMMSGRTPASKQDKSHRLLTENNLSIHDQLVSGSNSNEKIFVWFNLKNQLDNSSKDGNKSNSRQAVTLNLALGNASSTIRTDEISNFSCVI